MKLKTHFLIALLMLGSLTLSKVIMMDVKDLDQYFSGELNNTSQSHFGQLQNSQKRKLSKYTPNETYELNHLINSQRNLETADSGTSTEPVIDPLSEDDEPTPTATEPAPVAISAPTEPAPEDPPTVENPTEEPLPENAAFQLTPHSGKQQILWPALCETTYNGTQWGKSDESTSYFTVGSKSYKCPNYSKRDDLTRKPFDSEQRESPCPQLIAADSRNIKWAPVIIKTTLGEVPGKVRYFDDSGKTRMDGVFAYMGKSYRGPVTAWLC